MAILSKVLAAFSLILGLAASPSASALTYLPNPDCGLTPGKNCLQFGDFSVFSLALLNFAATGNAANPNPGDPFYVKSAPGEIKEPNYIVYGTGASGQDVTQNALGMDNSFATPNAGGGFTSFSTTFFDVFDTDKNCKKLNCDPSTVDLADSSNGGSWDRAGSWDALTSAVRGTLGGNQFAVFFNLNETGGDGLSGIDLLAWAKVTLEKDDGTTKDFYLSGMVPGDPTGKNLSAAFGAPDPTASPGALCPLGGDPGVGDSCDPRWTYVHGTICARQAAPGVPQFLHFGPCTGADPADAHDLNQNLGANQASFAVFNQEISDAVMDASKGWTKIHITYEFGQENNGYEQLFSQSLSAPEIPEPSILSLLGLSLLGLFAVRAQRKSQ